MCELLIYYVQLLKNNYCFHTAFPKEEMITANSSSSSSDSETTIPYFETCSSSSPSNDDGKYTTINLEGL